jgi:hypothetical protein
MSQEGICKLRESESSISISVISQDEEFALLESGIDSDGIKSRLDVVD